MFISNPVGAINNQSLNYFLQSLIFPCGTYVGHMWDIFCKNRVNFPCVFSQVVRRQVSIATDHFDDSNVLQYLSDDGQ